MAWVGTGQAGSAGEVPAHALVAAELDEAAGRLALLIRARRPDVVATYEPGGGYGHPDHVRAHAITMRAVELAADPAWPPRATVPRSAPDDRMTEPVAPAVLWAVTDPAALRAGYRALAADPAVRALLADRADRRATREGPLALPAVDGPLPSVADAALAAGPGLRVPVAPVLDRLLGALRAHATQVQAVTPTDPASGVVAALALSNLVLAPVLADETYAWAPGHAPAADAVWPGGVRAS
jgi:N-acetyl-1-D-myo-inositol-2-amino-2-deoxy-alpha-D-glucopyranoside deacetylase